MRNRWYPGRNRDLKVEWDFENRLVKVTKSDGTVVENTYDVDGVLVRTSVNGVGTDLLVDMSGGLSHVVAEIDGNGTVTALYVRAGDMLLEEIRGGVAKMYEADGLGSTRSLLDTTGTQTDTWSYEAFGTTLSSTGTSASPYRFAGERFVDGVGLYQNRARWLDTRVGQFISVDPLRGWLQEPITQRPYLYAAGSPIIFVDANGEMFTVAEIGIANIIQTGLANTQASFGFAVMDQIQYGGWSGLTNMVLSTIVLPAAITITFKTLAKMAPAARAALFKDAIDLSGKNAVAHVKSHIQHARETAMRMGMPRPDTIEDVFGFLGLVAKTGERRVGKWGVEGEVEFIRLGDAVVVRRMNGQYITNLDHSLGGHIVERWEEAVVKAL